MSKKKLLQTPSQTVGPFFAYGLTPEQYNYRLASVATPELADDDTQGSRIRIEGRVFDGNGDTIPDAMIEIWQADHQGRYAHPADSRRPNSSFSGFGRTGTGTDASHRFWFHTIKPGRIDDQQAPHVNVIVFMRGLPTHAYTRLYFAEETQANAADPVLNAVPVERRHTLLAERIDRPGTVTYRFDIHMQGSNETVFLDY
jgi:protocatechuate 3,4-dioxygenase alpha subunit